MTTVLMIAIFGTSPLLYGVETNFNQPPQEVVEEKPPANTEQVPQDPQPEQAYGNTSPTDTPKEVGKASEEGMASATRDTWIKFGVAAAAVAVAVVALVLVSK